MKAVKGSFEVFKNIVKERGHCSTCPAQRRMTIMQTSFTAVTGFCKNAAAKVGMTAAEHYNATQRRPMYGSIRKYVQKIIWEIYI